MANLNNPSGFQPVGMLNGAEIPVRRFPVDGATAVAIFKYDLVIAEADGHVIAHNSAGSNEAACLGSVVGIYDSNGVPVGAPNSSVTTKYLPASTEGFVDVALALKEAIFRAQSNASIAETERFGGAPHIATAGDTTTGVSKHAVGTVTTGAEHLIVIDKVDDPANSWGSTYVDVLVVFGHSFWSSTAVGAAL